MQKGKIFIGTSNVVIPGNKTTFPECYQSGSRLCYYGALFNSVEINSSFYKTPLFSTYKKWATEVPEDFKFSIKLSKEITHVKNLDFDLSGIKKFMEAAEGLGNKKGCLLIQFPGKITIDYFSKVEQILESVQVANKETGWQPAVEFRNSSWYIAETIELLNFYNAIMVSHDHPKAKMPAAVNADCIFLRFHGPNGDYRDGYSDTFLKSLASDMKKWINIGKDVYVYYNNTIGDAFKNAQLLKKYTSKF